MKAYGDIYSSIEDINTPFGIRRIGVAVSTARASWCDVEAHYPEVVSGAGGRSGAVLTWEREAREATQTVIEKIDLCIAELQRQRERLKG